MDEPKAAVDPQGDRETPAFSIPRSGICNPELHGERRPVGPGWEIVSGCGLPENFQTGLAQLRPAEGACPDDAAPLKANPGLADMNADNLSLMQGLSCHQPEPVVGTINDSPSRFSAAFRRIFPHGDGQSFRNPRCTARERKLTLHEGRHRLLLDFADFRNISRSYAPVNQNFQ